MEVQLSERTRRALEALRPATDIASAIEAVTLDAIRLRLRECVEEIGAFESRHGVTFEQFSAAWRAGQIAEGHSPAIERDDMEWEALTMERSELLALIRDLSTPASARA